MGHVQEKCKLVEEKCQLLLHTSQQADHLEKSLEKASRKQQQDLQHTASMQALESLEAEVGPAKDKWLGILAQYPSSLDKATEQEVTKKCEEANEHKELCDNDLKSLNKALAPTKLWAKNSGLLES